MVYVMWGLVLCCRFTSSVIAMIKRRWKRWARQVTFAGEVSHMHTVLFVKREEKGACCDTKAWVDV